MDLDFLQLTAAAAKVASVPVTAADKPAGSKAKTVDGNFTHKVQTDRLVKKLIPVLASYPERQVSCTFAAPHASADLVGAPLGSAFAGGGYGGHCLLVCRRWRY